MPPPKATILVADDRQANRAYLTALLLARGYETLEAEDGVSALEVLCKRRPDVVLIDILMPRMDGYEFVRRVRSDPAVAQTPIILLTAHYRPEQAQALAGGFGVTHIMTKPIEPEMVLAVVEQALNVRGPAAPSTPPGDDRPASAFRAQSPAAFKEEHRRLLTDTLAQKASQLEIANDRLRGLVNLGRRLASERDPRRLLSIFSSAAGDLVAAEYVLLAVADQEPVPATSHVPPRDSSDAAPYVYETRPFSIRNILANGRDPAVVGRISSAGAVAELLRRHGHARNAVRVSIAPDLPGNAALVEDFAALAPELILAPIATASRQYGLIAFGSLPPAARGDSSIDSIAQSMGAVLGVAYENAIRYEEIERHARLLQSEIAERRLAEERIARLNAELEQRVADRTAELQRSHERLRQSERMASLGTLCAGLGHDMGNLLLPIRARLDMIEDQVDTSTNQHVNTSTRQQGELESPAPARDVDLSTCGLVDLSEHVGAIRQCIQYIGDLTSGLRLLSLDPEDETGQPPATDVHEWWTQVQPLMRSALPRRIELDASIPQDPVALGLARHRLTQAVFNLVQNAGDAMRARDGSADAAGRVSISIELVEPTSEKNGAAPRVALLKVSDDGPGMTEAVARRAIEPFFTTKSRGLSTGLGLSLVHGIAQSAGGSLAIDSAPGRGTTVALTLPLARVSPFGQDGASDDARRTALVSVSHPRLKALCVSMLDVLGFRVDCTSPDDLSRTSEEKFATMGEDAVWITETSAAPIESIRRFIEAAPAPSPAPGKRRRVALLGDRPAIAPASAGDAPANGNQHDSELALEDLPGCHWLGSNPTAAHLRAELRRLFGRSARQAAATPTPSEVA